MRCEILLKARVGGAPRGKQIGEAGMSAKEYTYCEHGRVKELVVCRQCCEAALSQTWECVAPDKKAKKKSVGGKIPCEHQAERRRCKVCVGSWICAHGKNKTFCRECDGRRLCQACRKVTMQRCWEKCAACRRAEGLAEKDARRKWKGPERAELCI